MYDSIAGFKWICIAKCRVKSRLVGRPVLLLVGRRAVRHTLAAPTYEWGRGRTHSTHGRYCEGLFRAPTIGEGGDFLPPCLKKSKKYLGLIDDNNMPTVV